MNNDLKPAQTPAPGANRLMFQGDTVTFTLTLPAAVQGKAWIRTTIGHAAAARQSVINQVDRDIQPLGREWYDIAMKPLDERRFSVTLPLNEVGHFEAKCFFLGHDQTGPIWPAGPNTVLNVEPADTCGANIIYNAFVRQFGPNKDGSARPGEEDRECIRRLDEREYTVIPRSGTFRDLIRELDFIINELGCRVLQLLPIHPTPTTYGRMGRFGSPFAALNFTGVDPALAEFDPSATPLEQFTELVDAVHARQGRLFLDIAVNHMGWAANLHETHPHWLVRDENGEIQVPGAWGVRWSDLTSLDYSQPDLWQYIAEVFLTWCRRGVDGFRCDAGYMIPVPAWTYIVAVVREQFPDTIFLLEGLGGKISVTREILDRANFNWAYSELFQNYDRGQIENYLPEALTLSAEAGNMIHFAETHDNDRLAARSATYAAMRTALCALVGHQGGFGFANGVEWLADVKIDVHQARPLNWGSPHNLIDHIRRLNRLLRTHPAFFHETELAMIQQGTGNVLVIRRHHHPSGKTLLIVVNLDDQAPVQAAWQAPPDQAATAWLDLLSEQTITLTRNGENQGCSLEPGQVLCLTPDETDREYLVRPLSPTSPPEKVVDQKMRAVILDIFRHYHGTVDMNDFDLTGAVDLLRADPVECCRFLNPDGDESRIIHWDWPRDLNREVMVLPGHFLLIRAPRPFRVLIAETSRHRERITACRDSLPAAEGNFFALLTPGREPEAPRRKTLRLFLFEAESCRHQEASLLFLTGLGRPLLDRSFSRTDLADTDRMMLATNGRGAMCRANLDWGRLNSKYDALLAANLSPEFPEDRWIMFTRCRAWVVYQDFSQEIRRDCLDTFQATVAGGRWRFRVPTGQGESIYLVVSIRLVPGLNRVEMEWHRPPSTDTPGQLTNDEPVKLILRPDIDDRNFHEVTKAYTGPEHHWPAAVSVEADYDAFAFAPDPARRLRMRVPESRFVYEPEWQYLVSHPLEAERGLEAASDLFSPGYFTVFLEGGRSAALTATVDPTGQTGDPDNIIYQHSPDTGDSPDNSLLPRLKSYLVQRGDH
ncbi:MAG: glycogen debranching enzyme N-terminal domain-containing protein, partial [Desulfosudaceae bacterium]